VISGRGFREGDVENNDDGNTLGKLLGNIDRPVRDMLRAFEGPEVGAFEERSIKFS
jgi:hypothetical protein